MKIPPKKPHFFKPILPGFKNGLKIPIGFLKYLKGHEYIEHAVLKRAGKKWLVKVNGQKLEEGNWGKFAEDFDLQVGNILVFRHEGNMEFEVSIFDSTHCSREYPRDMHEYEDEYEVEGEDEDKYEVQEEEEEEDEYVVQEDEENKDEVEDEENKDEVEEEEEDEYEVEEEEEDEYEVEEEEEEEEVEEEERMSTMWKKRRRISTRWKKRRRTRTRTRYVAEEEDEEEEEEDEYEEEEEEEGATHVKRLGQSHFECTIGQYRLYGGLFFLPQQFALANGLTNKKCRLIVRDERQRSWKLKLCSSQNPRPRAYIGKGWREFIAENCIKEGDRIMFVVVSNGKTPVWKFQVVTDGEIPMKKFQEKPSPSIKLSNKTSSHAEAATNRRFVQSHFECNIREYCFSRGLLYLPKQFAFANGLIHKYYDLVIRDDRQRSWNLKLNPNNTRAFIGDGWRKFIADNCLKEGDRIKFEIVTNGETPIWKFHFVSEAETPLQKFQDIMKKSSNMTSLNAEVSTSTSGDDDDHPYFVSTIKPYCISKTEFPFPLDFAKSNGLTNRKCEMILKDKTERCWSVGLGRLGNGWGITSGWTKFRAANGIQVGDAYKFELIKNGEIPIAQFHCKYSAKVAKRKKH